MRICARAPVNRASWRSSACLSRCGISGSREKARLSASFYSCISFPSDGELAVHRGCHLARTGQGAYRGRKRIEASAFLLWLCSGLSRAFCVFEILATHVDRL